MSQKGGRAVSAKCPGRLIILVEAIKTGVATSPPKIQDGAAQWNFTFYLPERILEQQRAVHDQALETSLAIVAPLGEQHQGNGGMSSVGPYGLLMSKYIFRAMWKGMDSSSVNF